MGGNNIFHAQLSIKNKPIVLVSYSIAFVLAALLVIWLNLSWRPDVPTPSTDSGFYAYYGKAILQGQIPYRDLWDNKPPLGYYLNALALLIFGKSLWGIWWSGIVWILGCTVLIFIVLRKLMGNTTAWIASALFLVALMNPELFEGGNMMEVYSLAPQIGIIGVTSLFFTRHRKSWFAALAGILTACAFLIKQPSIVLGCSAVLLMILSPLSELKIRQAFKIGLGFVFGFAGLVAVVSVYWLWAGALGQFIDGALLQGFSYIGGQESHLREYFFYNLVNVLPNLYIGKLYFIALLSGGAFLLEKFYQFWIKPVLRERLSVIEWCLLIVLFLFPMVAKNVSPNSYVGKFWIITIFSFGLYILIKYYRSKSRPIFHQVFSPVEWIWLIAMISLPLEVLMASLGGRYFGHYFITMLPAVTVAVAYPIWKVTLVSRESLKTKGGLVRNSIYVVLMITILVWGVASFVYDTPPAVYTKNIAGIVKGQIWLNDLEQYIIQTTNPDDEVLVWHIHLGINFITDRRAPSRFLFPLNLFIPASEQNTKLEQYVDELEENPPELIVIQKVSSLALPFVDEPVDQLCNTYCTPEFEQALNVPQIRQEWLRFQQFFVTHYDLDVKIYDWIVFRKQQ
ncbi:MAG: hypothetical protein A2Y88_10710 [Chloroflexi bacterium RBG_13_48_10]|nr:MAG: hypothetical protein A2Y88_10710 [Chloroflexi bacterium RBG_13_48_10]